jgi:hypothetical protein
MSIIGILIVVILVVVLIRILKKHYTDNKLLPQRYS